MSNALPSRPTDATLTVTKAARLLGVHPEHRARVERRRSPAVLPDQSAWRPALPPERPSPLPRRGRGRSRGDGRRPGPLWTRRAAPCGLHPADLRPTGDGRSHRWRSTTPTIESPELALIDALARLAAKGGDLDENLTTAATTIRDLGDHHLVAIWELRGERLVPRVSAGASGARDRLTDRARAFGVLGEALADAVVGGGRGRASTSDPDPAPLPVLPGDRVEMAAVIPGPMGPWGVLHVVADRRRAVRLPGHASSSRSRPTRSAPSPRSPGAATTPPASCIAPRPCAGSPATSAAGSTSTGSCPDSSTTRWSSSRPTVARVFLRRPDGVDRGRGEPRPVGRLPGPRPGLRRLARCRWRRWPSGDRCSRSATATTRAARTCAPPSSRRASTRSAPRRCSTTTSSSACSTSTTTARTPGPTTTSRRWPRSRPRPRSPSAPPRTTSRWRRGPHSSSRSSSSARGSTASRMCTRSASPSRPSSASSSTTTTSASIGSMGNELIPVAMKGQVGEYVDETPDQLRVAVGEGITGWVAEHGVAGQPRRRRQRPASRHHPGHRGRPRRVDAARPDDLRRPGARRRRPLEARARPVHATTTFACSSSTRASPPRRWPTPTPPSELREQSAALERQVRGQRELLADHRVDPDDPRRSRRPREHHRTARRPRRLRQHRHRGRRLRRPDCSPR